MEKMDFFDAALYYGNPFLAEGPSARAVVAAMQKAGIHKAVSIFEEQEYAPPQDTAAMVHQVVSQAECLYGLVTVAPACTGELPPPEQLFAQYGGGRMVGLLLCPDKLRIPMHPIFLAEWFAFAQQRQLPVWLRLVEGLGYEYLANVLERYPELPVVLRFADEWPNARRLYPLVNAFPKVYVCTSDLIWLGGLEDFCGRFGSGRLLFSSEYPHKYFGSSMLALLCSGLAQSQKADIAAGNLERLLGGIRQ